MADGTDGVGGGLDGDVGVGPPRGVGEHPHQYLTSAGHLVDKLGSVSPSLNRSHGYEPTTPRCVGLPLVVRVTSIMVW
jgi:hypothetical protein